MNEFVTETVKPVLPFEVEGQGEASHEEAEKQEGQSTEASDPQVS